MLEARVNFANDQSSLLSASLSGPSSSPLLAGPAGLGAEHLQQPAEHNKPHAFDPAPNAGGQQHWQPECVYAFMRLCVCAFVCLCVFVFVCCSYLQPHTAAHHSAIAAGQAARTQSKPLEAPAEPSSLPWLPVQRLMAPSGQKDSSQTLSALLHW
jgi:hypothetical protein